MINLVALSNSTPIRDTFEQWGTQPIPYIVNNAT